MSETEKSKGKTLSFIADDDLVRRVDELATADQRSRSAWLALQVRKAIAQQDNGRAA